MDILQMHRMIDVGVQEVASHVYDEILPEEKDLVLNNMIEAFVERNIPTQDNQENIDKVRTLRSTYESPAFKMRGGWYVFLPSDYRNLFSSSSRVAACMAPEEQNLSYYRAVIPVDLEGSDNFKISLAGEKLFDIKDYNPDYGIIDKDNVEEVQLLARQTIRPKINVYWENYDGIEYVNSLIFIATDPALHNKNITLERKLPVSRSLSSVQVKGTPSEGKYRANRLAGGAIDRFEIPFLATSARSPWASIQQNRLEVYGDGFFSVDSIALEYIRRPKVVGLRLNSDCDLPETYHKEIVNDAVRHFLELFGSTRYESKIIENQHLNP